MSGFACCTHQSFIGWHTKHRPQNRHKKLPNISAARAPHLWPACCCRTIPRSWPVSSKSPTGTDSTGPPPWPTPGSAWPQYPDKARRRRTRVPPTSGASAPTPGPPPWHSPMKTSPKVFFDFFNYSPKNNSSRWRITACVGPRGSSGPSAEADLHPQLAPERPGLRWGEPRLCARSGRCCCCWGVQRCADRMERPGF